MTPTEKWCRDCRRVLPAAAFYTQRKMHRGREYLWLSTRCRAHHNRQVMLAREKRDPQQRRAYELRRYHRRAAAARAAHSRERKQLAGEMRWALGQIKEITGLPWRGLISTFKLDRSCVYRWRNGTRQPRKRSVERVFAVYRQVAGL